MIRRTLAALLVASLSFGCGASQTTDTTTEKKVEAEPKTQSQRITNISYIDLAVCSAKPPAVPEVVNKEVMMGLLVAARPQVMECFVDPKNRGAAKETRASVKTTIGGGKLENAVTGENLSPEGVKCVQGAIDKWFAASSNLASKAPAGSAPVAAEVPFQHMSGGSTPSVQLGVNEGSDIAAAIRLAQGSWCDCYAEWKDAAPRPLKAKIRLVKHAAESAGARNVSPAEVTFEPTQDAASDRVAACLQKKVSGLTFSETSEELTLPYTFLFVNSSMAGLLGDESPPDLRFAQVDGLRGQRAAAAVIAVGARTTAATTYDDLVKKYKAKPDSVPVDDLKARCGDLLKADDAWIASIEAQLDIDQKTLTLASDLKAKDPQWAKAQELAQSSVDATKKDLDAAKKIKTDDTGICPKERK